MASCDNSFSVSPETEKFLCDRLIDPNQPISERFRALFSLRNLRGPAPRKALILDFIRSSKAVFGLVELGNFVFARFACQLNWKHKQDVLAAVKCIHALSFIIATRDSSNLLAHEAAFALGQMQDADAVPALAAVLNDFSLHPIVRHEAAEALGAIGLESNVSLLKNSLAVDPAQEVRETCELALRRIDEVKNAISDDGMPTVEASPFLSVDPAAPASSCSSVDQLREVLLDEAKGMYERYAALFALRNHGGDEAVSVIVDSLSAKSALLRHEVAYVLGQLQDKAASAALSNVLRNVNEHPMVRHEAAEALGSIADEHSVALLEEFAKDPEPIVSQSCEVALTMLEFERSGKSFEYLFMQTPQVL